MPQENNRDLIFNATAGTDKRGESEERYGKLDRESTYRPRHGDREREYQEQEERLNKKAALRDGNQKGAGSKVEGAFGNQVAPGRDEEDLEGQGGGSDPEDARYRRDEKHDGAR